MRTTFIAFASLFVVSAVSGAAAEEGHADVLCKALGPKISQGGPESRSNGLALLETITQMLSPLGRPVMASNLATTVAINNEATPALQAQALIDAQITGENANTLADGLGATLGGIYRATAFYKSKNDGATAYCGEISPAVTAMIAAVNATSRGDAAAGKMGYANETSDLFQLPTDGTYDAIGKAYGLDPTAKGADPYGDPRPFQTAPVDAASGPRIKTYDGRDFFGLSTTSRVMLEGVGQATDRTGSDLTESPSFPSGHTTFGYSEALILAMMVPERYRALAYRASEYGNSRIVIGAHYAIDVIGGRTLATYDLAQDLAGTPGYARVGEVSLRTALAKAAVDLRGHLTASLKGATCASIADCARRDPIVRAENASVFVGGTSQPSTTGQAYRFRLTYGLSAIGVADLPPEPVPVQAAALLATRFPYLTEAQRLEVLRSTEGPAGHFLDVNPLDGSPLLASAPGPRSEAGVYSRLDLYAAAGGYGAFDTQVVVVQDAAALSDPDLQPFLDFARVDTWPNDIGGPGGLTKRGSGTLALTGTDTYAGPTTIEGGTLTIGGSITSATKIEAGGTLAGTGRVGDVVVAPGGRLTAGGQDGAKGLTIQGSLDLADGAICAFGASPAVQISGPAKLGGAHLVLKSGAALRPGLRLPILVARGGISGTFADVIVEASAVKPTMIYTKDTVYLTLDAGAASSAK